MFPATTAFTTFYQAKIVAFLDENNNNITPAGYFASNQMTVILGFGETGSRLDGFPAGGSTASFAFDPTNPINYFAMFHNTALTADDLTGTGFTDGNKIFEAQVTAADGTFSVPDLNDIQQFDQFPNAGDDDYPGVDSVVGSGGGDVAGGNFTDIDTDYFIFPEPEVTETTTVLPDGSILITRTTTGSTLGTWETGSLSLRTPFNAVDPSANFVVNPDGTLEAHNIGNVNGFSQGPQTDFQFQADASVVFNTVTTQQTETTLIPPPVIPEPTSLLLFGMGLGGAGLAYIRRRRGRA
jgi:hypothetical protein